MRIRNSQALASAVRSSRTSLVRRNALRTFSSTQYAQAVVSSDTPNMRLAQRDPDSVLKAPIINPADKYAAKADDMHRYGSWLMGCLPKYIQQFSVWKDELVIYISPAGIMPVFTFLKCMAPNSISSFRMLTSSRQHRRRVHTSQRHHCGRLSHTRPAFRSRLQPAKRAP